MTAHAPAQEAEGLLREGQDFRLPAYRREVFLRFYAFHLRYRAHPGGVYYLLPHLAQVHGWDLEQRLWFAFINGNTQHPLTSWLLWRAGPSPARAEAMLAAWRDNYPALAFDTDRRHHKAQLHRATRGYLALLGGRPQADYWHRAAEGGWAGLWQAALAIPTFGRLSAWSFLEYLRLAGIGTDADSLLLEDRDGSRSHRNGLALVCGRDDLDWHASNPGFDGHYSPAVLSDLALAGEELLAEAKRRAVGQPWAPDVTRLTLESALCTYKSWHRPNRRYPNVYNDLAYDRIRQAEHAWPSTDFGWAWEARRQALPAYLRLEDCPNDPGCVPVKQNHYRLTGQVVMMDRDHSCFRNDFNDAVAAGAFGPRKDHRR